MKTEINYTQQQQQQKWRKTKQKKYAWFHCPRLLHYIYIFRCFGPLSVLQSLIPFSHLASLCVVRLTSIIQTPPAVGRDGQNMRKAFRNRSNLLWTKNNSFIIAFEPSTIIFHLYPLYNRPTNIDTTPN